MTSNKHCWIFDPNITIGVPYPIAYKLDCLPTACNTGERITILIDANRTIARFLGAITLAHYLRGVPNPETNRSLKRLLSKDMNDGDRLQIPQAILKTHVASRDAFVIPELVDFYYNEVGKQSGPLRVFESWVQVRNRLPTAHSESNEELTSEDAFAQRLFNNLGQTIQRMSFLREYDLMCPLKVSSRHPTIKSALMFRGPSRFFQYHENLEIPLLAGPVEQEESMLLVSKKDPRRQTLLSPLIRRSDEGEVFLLDHLIQEGGAISDAKYVATTMNRGAFPATSAPHGDALVTDFQTLFASLAGVGVTPFSTPSHPSSLIGGDPWWGLDDWVRAWVQSNYSYQYILQFEDEVPTKAALRTPGIWKESGRPEMEAFVLVVALHYQLAWQFWANRNQMNEFACRRLLERLVDIHSFKRPGLRALCALQLFDKVLLRRVLEEETYSAQDKELIERYVITENVPEYLRYLVMHGPGDFPAKADAVLREVNPIGQRGFDLPLPPTVQPDETEEEDLS